MAGQPPEGAHLIGAFLSVTAFGLYTSLYFQTLYQLKRKAVGSILLLVNLTALWLMTLIVTVLHITSIYHAFVALSDKMNAGQYYDEWYKQTWSTVMSILTKITGIIGNTFFCWRLYVMWKRSWKVLIAPAILILGLVVCSIMTSIYAIKCRTSPKFVPFRTSWQLGFTVLGLMVNGLVIGLMWLKIWRVSKSISNIAPTSAPIFHHARQVLIESGALYAITAILALIMKGANLVNGTVIFIYVTPQVMGLVPTLIVLRMTTSVQPGPEGHDIPPPTSQRLSVSRPVFAHTATVATGSSTTTQISEMRYDDKADPKASLNDRISRNVQVVEMGDGSDVSSRP